MADGDKIVCFTLEEEKLMGRRMRWRMGWVLQLTF